MRAVPGRGVGVLGERLARDHPRHLRQGARQDVRADRRRDVVRGRAGHLRDRAHAPVVQRVAGPRVGEPLEVREAVVAVVVLGVLVDLPAHPGALERLRVRLPGQAPLLAAVLAGGVDLPAPQEGAVGAGGAERRAEVRVADRVVVGERVVEGDVLAVEVAEGADVAHARHPVVEASLVPGRVLRGPAVRQVAVALRQGLTVHPSGRRGVAELPRVLAAAQVRLVEGSPAAGQVARRAVGEAPHPAQGAEVVVEAAVLLHEDHHVPDVGEGAGRGPRDGRRGRRRQRRPRHEPRADADEPPAADGKHAPPLVSRRAPAARRTHDEVRGAQRYTHVW